MQEILTKQKTQSEHYHTRLWWMEVLRGVVSIIFGILLIVLTRFTLDLLIYLLGSYLFVDGLLDIFKVATGRRETKRKWTNYLFGIISIVLSLISFINPLTTILLIISVIVVRIITRGARVIIDARHSQHKYEGVTWLLGILLLLFGIALILTILTTSFQYFTLGLIILLILIYAFIDGLYLLIRGLLLRFRPSFFTASIAKAPESLLDLPEAFPPTTRRAIVFVRRPGANGLGHIGWAFEWNNGWFNAGSVQNDEGKPFVKPQEMGFWSTHTVDPIGAMQKRLKTYDEYKIFYVTQPQPKDAWKTVIWESRQPYSFLHHNCNDVSYDILRVYGATELMDPVEGPVPNDWYDALAGRSYMIEENPTIPVHLHKMSKRELATKEIMLTIPSRIKGTAPPWRVNGWRAWQELNFTLDKMLRDMRTLFVSVGKGVAKARATRGW